MSRRSRDRQWSRAAQIGFIIAGTIAAAIVSALAVVVTFGYSLPLALIGAIATAIGLWSIARLLDLNASPARWSLDCRDGRHPACLGCPCSCHQES